MGSRSLKDRILEKWAGLRMAEEAVMVDDLSELLQINREAVKSHNRTHLENYEDGEMGNIHVGDIVTNEGGEMLKKGVGKGLLATLVLGALAGGSGLGFFVPLLFGGGEGAQDVDTRYNLGLGKPDAQESNDEIPDSKGQDQRR